MIAIEICDDTVKAIATPFPAIMAGRSLGQRDFQELGTTGQVAQ